MKVIICVDNVLNKFVVNDWHYRANNIDMYYLIYIDNSLLQLS